MGWDERLPDGVHLSGTSEHTFTLGVPLPVGEDGLMPLRCPTEPDHRFKLRMTDEPSESDGDTLYCPYCGHPDQAWSFMPEQLDRMTAAARAAAEQFMHEQVTGMFNDAFGGLSRPSGRSGISVEFRPSGPPPRRSLPSYDIDETRRTMRCEDCDETVAVYGMAFYCPTCGQMAPARQFTALIDVQQERLEAFEAMDPATRQRLDEAGVITATFESTLKDGFGALETYLKNLFLAGAPGLAKPPKSTVFQRLDDTHDLYQQHLGMNLVELCGPDVWSALLRAASIRHVLTHNAGVIDTQFLARMPEWPQAIGQRITVHRGDVDTFLAALRLFSEAVL